MKKRVLIVEDDITLEAFWMSVFHKINPKTEITWVCSERDAEHEILQKHKRGIHFDLIISDLFLAGPRTGIDLWEIVGEELRGKMILTSGVHPEKFRRYFGDHTIAPPFLQKPYSMPECVETIRWMINSDEQTLSPPVAGVTYASA